MGRLKLTDEVLDELDDCLRNALLFGGDKIIEAIRELRDTAQEAVDIFGADCGQSCDICPAMSKLREILPEVKK